MGYREKGSLSSAICGCTLHGLLLVWVHCGVSNGMFVHCQKSPYTTTLSNLIFSCKFSCDTCNERITRTNLDEKGPWSLPYRTSHAKSLFLNPVLCPELPSVCKTCTYQFPLSRWKPSPVAIPVRTVFNVTWPTAVKHKSHHDESSPQSMLHMYVYV